MLDINGLMLGAVLALDGESLEGALVVVLFVSANVLEDTHAAKMSSSLSCTPRSPLYWNPSCCSSPSSSVWW